MEKFEDIKDVKRFNQQVFASMPDEPYLGPVSGFDEGVSVRRVSVLDWCFRAVAVLLLGLVLWQTFRPAEDADTLEFTAKAAAEYIVPAGVRSSVTLPDSSVIWLNSGSRLLVADDFSMGNREVSLIGEGYFEVEADSEHPFLVRTPSGPTVRVTGTAFNLSCYSPQKEIKVTLLRGSVDILTGQDEVIPLEAGEKITVRGQFSATEQNPDIEGDTAWTQGTLHFDDTPMREVISSIERWYGVNVTVKNPSVYRNSFTADFRSESVNQVLELMAITCDLVYVIDGREVILN